MNAFDALNIFYREDVISDFLKNCFEDSRHFLNQFLKSADLKMDKNYNYKVINRLGLGKPIGTPDMVIYETEKQVPKIIIIENKLGTGEGIQQTLRYESELAQQRILRKLNLEAAEFHFIFLTLDTTVLPGSSKFKSVHYSSFLNEGSSVNNAALNRLLEDFKEKLNEFYIPVSDPVKALTEGIPMDTVQQKICWQNILMEKFKDETELNISWGEAGGAGRNNFIFLISKPNWKSGESFEETGLDNTFYIHVDTYINLLSENGNTVKDIGIRYETNPYKPHNQIKDLPGYDKFIENKNNFAAVLNRKLQQVIPDATQKRTSLLTAAVPVNQNSLEESVDDYYEKVKLIETVIDETISEIKKNTYCIKH